MSQHPEQRSKKSSGKSTSGKDSNLSSGHGNAREAGKKGSSTHGRH